MRFLSVLLFPSTIIITMVIVQKMMHFTCTRVSAFANIITIPNQTIISIIITIASAVAITVTITVTFTKCRDCLRQWVFRVDL